MRESEATAGPATLQVLRYDAHRDDLSVVVGQPAEIPRELLAKHAIEALRASSFICHTVDAGTPLGADEVCFIPRDQRCEIVSIHTNGWRRHHGDHRRSLVEILNDLAAAVARGQLTFLDDGELAVLHGEGVPVIGCEVEDSASLRLARGAVARELAAHRLSGDANRRMQLCVSEATTNMLVHGGGGGTMEVRRLGDRLRVIVADRGPGLNFLNWTGEGEAGSQPSMGYGYKIILDNVERVYLHTGAEGTTLVMERAL